MATLAARVDLDLTFLGTGGSIPTARRSTACLLVRAGGRRLMIDCGEGSQRQMQRSTGLIAVEDIFLTHFHADHFLGVPGLLKSWDLQGREQPLQIYGPEGLIDLFGSLRRLFGRIGYEVELIELAPGDAVEHDGYRVEAHAVDHRTRALGYALVEADRPGRFDPAEAERLGVAPGPDFGRLQAGEEVAGAAGSVRPEQVMGESRRGRRLVASGDTRPCEATLEAARAADLLVHDASFLEDDLERALETGHSTAREAARLAAEAGVELLALVHISTRYHVGAVLDEAREEHEAAVAPRDFDVIELPLPERGPPQLLSGAAKG